MLRWRVDAHNAVARPSSSLESSNLFAALGEITHVAIAVSGGGDSMALLTLAHEWARQRGTPRKIIALTVDHGLRDESAAEAVFVEAQCAALGIPHQLLNWHRTHERGNLSAEARAGRYALMAEAAKKVGAQALLTGHTRDDQAETVLMRLARGSGVDGLSGIPAKSELHGISVHRPLLGTEREALREHLRAQDVGWCEDPSNADQSFDRVKVRTLMKEGEALGLSEGRLGATAEMMSLAREVLEDAADELSAQAAFPRRQGFFRLLPEAFAAARDETSLRLLTRLLGVLSGSAYRPSLDSSRALLSALLRGDENAGRSTLQGCRLVRNGKEFALVRELSACPTSRPLQSGTWDSRFRVRDCHAAETLSIAPIGEAGWAQIARNPEAAHLREAPYAARMALPAIWNGDTLAAIPSEGVWLSVPPDACVIEPLPPFGREPVEPLLGMLI